MDEELLSDDLMPNEGSSFIPAPPDELTAEINAERAMVTGAAPLIDKLLEWFDDEISISDSIDGLDVEAGISLEAQVLARQLLKAKLSYAKTNLQNLKDTYIK